MSTFRESDTMRDMGKPAEPLNPDPRPERKTFDAVLKQLCETPPLPRKKVKTGKKKLGKVLGK
jgi:hypothetical protein